MIWGISGMPRRTTTTFHSTLSSSSTKPSHRPWRHWNSITRMQRLNMLHHSKFKEECLQPSRKHSRNRSSMPGPPWAAVFLTSSSHSSEKHSSNNCQRLRICVDGEKQSRTNVNCVDQSRQTNTRWTIAAPRQLSKDTNLAMITCWRYWRNGYLQRPKIISKCSLISTILRTSHSPLCSFRCDLHCHQTS